MLKKRQYHIIDILNDKEQWVTGKALAQMMNVSDRTIRSDIEKINQEYAKEIIVSNKRFGYKIDSIAMSEVELSTTNLIPQTPQERSIWIIKELLFNSREINLFELENRVFVSGYSIDNDLQRIKKMIKNYQLTLKRSKNFVQLEGDENEKRKLYRKLLTDEIQGNFTNLSTLATLFPSFDFLQMSDLFMTICSDYDYQLKESLFPIVMIHAGVALERMLHNNCVEAIKPSGQEFEISLEYQISQEFFKQISQKYQVNLLEDEVIKFALILTGCHSHQSLLQDDLVELVNEVLKKIQENFEIDFSEDDVLLVGLANHISSLIERQKTNTSIPNIYLKEIKRKYPLIFEMAIHAGEVLADKLGAKVEENELSFIALHLGAAYDRVNSLDKYRAVVIIPHNQLLSKPFVDKLHQRFADRMTILSQYKLFDEREVKTLQADLILSTVPLKHNLSIPTLQLSLLFDYEDESRVFQALNQLDSERYKDSFQEMMENLLQKKLFYQTESVSDSSEAIEFLCKKLIEEGLADENYKKDVLKREEISATSFYQGFAVPHAIEYSASESCIATLTLDKPVLWGNFEVRLVILLAIREVDTQLMRIFFDWLSNLVTNPQKLSAVIQAKNQKEFMANLFQ